MERSVRVNAGSGRGPKSGLAAAGGCRSAGIHGRWEKTRPAGDPNPGADPDDPPNWPTDDGQPPSVSARADRGPCLYLGPSGQRCTRRATQGGFCSRHHPSALVIRAPLLSPKKIAAFMIALTMLWPEIVKIASAIIRLFH
jgi:hypothetical protein